MPQRFRMQKIQPDTLEKIRNFAEGLALPEPEHKLYIELRDSVSVGGKERVPYCLLLFADSEDIGFMNAGYVAGQTAVYLRFQGYCAYITRELPPVRPNGSGRVCVGIVAFGKAEQTGGRRKGEKEPGVAASTCVCRDLRGHWTEDVLALAKKRFHISGDNVRIMRGDNCVYFSPKFQTGKKRTVSEFETGIAIAYALAAAEELWVDLVLAKGEDHARHTICLMTAQG